MKNRIDMLIFQSAVCFGAKAYSQMAVEKSPARISQRLFATSRSENGIRLKNRIDMLIFQSAVCFGAKAYSQMAVEKSPARISQRLFATSRSEKRIKMRKDIIVIYNSQTGFTRKYAQWISEALECECVELQEADKLNFEQFDTIIFGGWACAGGINKIKWFKNNLKKWNDKKLAVYCVGGSPIENPELEATMKNWFTEEEHQKVKTFYCPGGFNYERMSGTSKLMMKMFIRALRAKRHMTEAEKIQVEMMSKSYDISDKKYIEPIIDWANHFYD